MTPLLTISQKAAAAMIGVSVPTFLREVLAGRIAYVTVGRRRRFKPSDLADYIDRQTDIEPEAPKCPSDENPDPLIGTIDSNSKVVNFTDRRNARLNAPRSG